MNDNFRKSVVFHARLKPMESDLLRAICFQENLTASEFVRQAIRERAQSIGIYHLGGQVVFVTGQETPVLTEVNDGHSSET